MNKETKITKNIIFKLILIFFIITPLLSAILFCLKDGKSILDVYIPLGGWSDEISYYKQIQGILKYGLPRGYFGYNQSKAIYGTLNVWGIFPLIPYILWGFIFKWTYVSPIFANIFFCILGLVIFVALLKPSKKSMIFYSIFWILNQYINRYVLSGVIEASFVMQLFIVATLGEYLLSERIERSTVSPKRLNIVYYTCVFFIFFLTIQRPYFAVLFLIPLIYDFKNHRTIQIIILPIIALASIVVFFVNYRLFCSVYFNDIMSSDNFYFGTIFSKLWEGAKQIVLLYIMPFATREVVWAGIIFYGYVKWQLCFLFVSID